MRTRSVLAVVIVALAIAQGGVAQADSGGSSCDGAWAAQALQANKVAMPNPMGANALMWVVFSRQATAMRGGTQTPARGGRCGSQY